MPAPAKAPREESASSESESEEEAEYRPNVSVSISHTQIPEEREEELELEREEKKEEKTAEPAAVVSSTGPKEEAESAEKKTEEEEEEGKELAGPADVPEEAPNAGTLSAGGAATEAAPVEEGEEPKMNGEASLAEGELRPQVICCSEVKSGASPGVDPSSRSSGTCLFLPPASLSVGVSFPPA